MTLKRIILAAAIVMQVASSAVAQTVFSTPYIGDRVIYVDTVADMLALPTGKVRDGIVVITRRYGSSHTAGDGSGNVYRADTGESGTPDGGWVIDDIGVHWHAVDKSVANVMQFGAVADFDYVGNTGTDDTAAIQAAIDAAKGSATGTVVGYYEDRRKVYFPPGTVGDYRVNGTLDVDGGVEICGDSRTSVRIWQRTQDSDTFVIGNIGGYLADVKISNLWIAQDVNASTDGAAINCTGVGVQLQVENVNTQYPIGLEMEAVCQHVSVSHCQFRAFESVGAIVRANHCEFRDVLFNQGLTGKGCVVYQGLVALFSSCTFQGVPSTALELNPESSGVVRNVTIDTCYFEGNADETAGIAVDVGGTNQVKKVVARNNRFTQTGDSGNSYDGIVFNVENCDVFVGENNDLSFGTNTVAYDIDAAAVYLVEPDLANNLSRVAVTASSDVHDAYGVEETLTSDTAAKLFGNTFLDGTSTGVDATLGTSQYVGQKKLFRCTNATNSCTVTISNHALGASYSYTFDAAGEYLYLISTGGGQWDTISATATVTP